MSDYVVLFPADDEAQWRASDAADHQAVFDTDEEFGRLLQARGGAVIGGAGFTQSDQARTITRGPGLDALVTEGPATRSDQQLSGFFIVSCDDYDALVDAARVLVRAHPVVEIRPVEEY